MTVSELLARIAEEHYPQVIWEPDFDTSCPCFAGCVIVDGAAVFAEGNCWRVSEHMTEDMQDLYVWQGPGRELRRPDFLRIACALKHKLDAQEWYAPYYLELQSPEDSA